MRRSMEVTLKDRGLSSRCCDQPIGRGDDPAVAPTNDGIDSADSRHGIAKRRRAKTRVGAAHRIKREEVIKWFKNRFEGIVR